jgi:hypothetical protein
MPKWYGLQGLIIITCQIGASICIAVGGASEAFWVETASQSFKRRACPALLARVSAATGRAAC